MSFDNDFAPFGQRMRAAGLPQLVIDTFAHYYEQLIAGSTGLIAESEIEAVAELPDAENLPAELNVVGREAISSTVFIKLNGGLGTSMGLDKAKSLLNVKDGLSFLDIIARQATAAGVPLLLMNSFRTRDDSLAALAAYPVLAGDVPRDFMQHKVPKVRRSDLAPVEWPDDPEFEWCPPGHGDIYTALVTTGTLAALLAAGYRRAFVSNADNLGAVIDESILGYFVREQLPFMMEVADRTPADRKGGHLARMRNSGGRLVLREAAQCADDDADAFQNIEYHRYFNTNNLWIDLVALSELMTSRNNILGLPMIRNSKNVDPRNPDSCAVFQLETAMGSAIEVFTGSSAIRVSRARFAPVKTTSDLLAVRSDDYVLDDTYRVLPNPERRGPAAHVRLDPQFFKLVSQLDARFPAGPPSLLNCSSFTVCGDVSFGADIVANGQVVVVNTDAARLVVPAHTCLTDRPS